MAKSLKLDVRIDIRDGDLKVDVQSAYAPEEDFVTKVKKVIEKLARKHYLGASVPK